VATKSAGWSRKLNAISDAVVKGQWLRRITLEKSGLEIEGSAISRSHNEMTLISSFVDNLKKDPAFSKEFSSIEINAVRKERRGAAEITSFIVTAKTK
jgi:hypothetical protein